MNADLLTLKMLVAELPPEQRDQVDTCADELRRVINDAGDAGKIALALVGMEESSEPEN